MNKKRLQMQKKSPEDAALVKRDKSLPGGQRKYNHVEAFCLMNYQCSDCGFREVLWNSRDGVTPFGITCPKCKGINHLHVDWHLDVFAPMHTPESGQRIFIDMPDSLKMPIARRRVQLANGTEYEVPEAQREGMAHMIVAEMQIGAPWVIVFP